MRRSSEISGSDSSLLTVEMRRAAVSPGKGLAAKVAQSVALAAHSASDAAVEVDAEEPIGAVEHTLRAANAALGELHRDHRRLRGKSGLQPFHQRGIVRDLMIARDRTVDDAKRLHHLLRRQAERPSGSRMV